MGEKEVAAALRAVLATVDRLPRAALQAANAAIRWRDLDADLAHLTADSGLELSHLRGEQPRLLTFRSGQTIIELEVSAAGEVARLLGQLDPPGEAEVTVESAGLARTTAADAQGRFAVAGLPPGWMRVVVAQAGGGTRKATEWFRA
jgi:hypothetical protein